MRYFIIILIFISVFLSGCKSSIQTSVMCHKGEKIYDYKYVYITNERNEPERSLEAKKYISDCLSKKGFAIINEITPEDSIKTISYMYQGSYRGYWNEGEKPHYEYFEEIIFYNLKTKNLVSTGKSEVEGIREYDYKRLIDKILNKILK